MKDIDVLFNRVIICAMVALFIIIHFWNLKQDKEIESLKAENLELAKNQLILSDKILNSKNTEIKLLDFLQRLTDKVISIDSLKIKE